MNILLFIWTWFVLKINDLDLELEAWMSLGHNPIPRALLKKHSSLSALQLIRLGSSSMLWLVRPCAASVRADGASPSDGVCWNKLLLWWRKLNVIIMAHKWDLRGCVTMCSRWVRYWGRKPEVSHCFIVLPLLTFKLRELGHVQLRRAVHCSGCP